MNGRELVWTPRHEPAGTVERALVGGGLGLEFPVRVLGRSTAAVFPRQVGAWWMEPFSERTQLPPRAAARLRMVLEAGISPRAVVVFHELPGASAALVTPVGPVTRLAERIEAVAPAIGRGLVRAIHQALQGAGGRLRRVGQSVRWSRKPAIKDPCLVIVTHDGTWVEIDRWYV